MPAPTHVLEAAACGDADAIQTLALAGAYCATHGLALEAFPWWPAAPRPVRPAAVGTWEEFAATTGLHQVRRFPNNTRVARKEA